MKLTAIIVSICLSSLLLGCASDQPARVVVIDNSNPYATVTYLKPGKDTVKRDVDIRLVCIDKHDYVVSYCMQQYSDVPNRCTGISVVHHAGCRECAKKEKEEK